MNERLLYSVSIAVHNEWETTMECLETVWEFSDKARTEIILIDNGSSDGTPDKLLEMFADAHFDYVYSSHALEDLADTEGALREWLRVLRPGGHPRLYELSGGVNCDHVYPGFVEADLLPVLEALGCERVDGFVHDEPGCYSTFLAVRKVDKSL